MTLMGIWQLIIGMTNMGELKLNDGRQATIIRCNYCKTLFVHIQEYDTGDDDIRCPGEYEKPCQNSVEDLTKLRGV